MSGVWRLAELEAQRNTLNGEQSWRKGVKKTRKFCQGIYYSQDLPLHYAFRTSFLLRWMLLLNHKKSSIISGHLSPSRVSITESFFATSSCLLLSLSFHKFHPHLANSTSFLRPLYPYPSRQNPDKLSFFLSLTLLMPIFSLNIYCSVSQMHANATYSVASLLSVFLSFSHLRLLCMPGP